MSISPIQNFDSLSPALEHNFEVATSLLTGEPTIANGQFIPNLNSVQKELEDYFAGNQRLKYYSILDHVIDKGWELTTKEIYELIGYRPKGKVYEYGSYRFRQVGKAGRNLVWSVYKVQIEYFDDLKIPLPECKN